MEAQVRAAQTGDVEAINALLTELAPWIGRLCGSIALDRGQDAMQETFIIVLRNLVTLREPAAFNGWVRRIAVRESLRMVTSDRELVVDAVPEVSTTIDVDSAIDVRDQLAALPPLQRAVLVLRDLEDLSEDDTASALGIERGTVKSRLHRARSAFREGWER